MTLKPKYICSKSPFKKIKMWGVIDYKIIQEMHRKIQANASTIQSELGGGQHSLLGLVMQPATYQTVTGHDLHHSACPPQSDPIPANPRYIQHHAAQVEQWRQIVNAEYILKQKLLESLDYKYFKG